MDTANSNQVFEGGGLRLERGDAVAFLKGLASDSVNLVLIDPPYEISRPTGFQACVNGEERFKVSMDFGEWDKGFTAMPAVMKEIKRVLVKGGSAIVFYDLWKIGDLKAEMEANGLKQVRLLEWIKTNPVPINSKRNYLTNAREIAVSCVKGSKPKFHSVYDNGVYHYGICRDKGRFHPTQKPVAFMVELIEKHTDKGDVVVDCFSGSGTTAEACWKSDRKFAGCELDEGYFLNAKLRLEALVHTQSAKSEVASVVNVDASELGSNVEKEEGGLV